MFHQPALPSLEEAIAAMAQEELRLKMMKGNASPPCRPVFMVTEFKETRVCYNCGEVGHLSRDCQQPLKPNRGRGRGRATRGGGSRGGRRGYRVNLAMIEEGTSDMVTIPVAELEELIKLKNEEKCSGDQETSASVDNVANMVHSNTGKEDWKKTWDWSKA
ncbi:hypothetical protein PVAP13_9KG603901 [Panicum virgatum]|uniref:CCHC-type domain-containing protein n=1 Tax=Panicum virgatum TaxID=38727 RepID=A0A8T0P1F6_PANVG|nr:hypothetical protein PVAP13_9KG603901 [Panicum virgatum]